MTSCSRLVRHKTKIVLRRKESSADDGAESGAPFADCNNSRAAKKAPEDLDPDRTGEKYGAPKILQRPNEASFPEPTNGKKGVIKSIYLACFLLPPTSSFQRTDGV